MKTTIAELADIGRLAALQAFLAEKRDDLNMALHPKSFAYTMDRPAREAFAAAVAEQVATEWSQIVVAEQAKKHEAISIIEQAIEMVNTPGTTAETLPKAINAKIMQRDEFHEATLKKLDAAKAEIARLIQLDATNQDNLERTHKALVDSQLAHTTAQRELETLRAELAKRDERLTKLEWRDVSVKPTREDADEQCRLHVQFTSGFYARKAYSDWPWIGCNVASYRPFCPPPAPSPEEIERREFEEFYNSYTVTKDPKGFAFDVWQAARATKEETP